MSSYGSSLMSMVENVLYSKYDLSFGLNGSTWNFPINRTLFWTFSGMCSFWILRKLNVMRRRSMNYLYSFFNAKKYLSP